MNQLRQSIPEILGQALELPEAERSAYLAAACEGDERMRQRVERLLAAVPKAAQFLEPPSADCSPTIDRGPGHTIGSHIGPYKLLEQIGEGGMGLVYMAEQQRPVRRLVALKVIKPGFDSKQTIARFEAERQALAMMDHPNIAKVLDAGTTEGTGSRDSPVAGGRPYFVMELVRGLAINEFCDQKRLTVRERLEIFIQVCQAVQHAHQKGVIHRDLKPTNVLITMADSVPFPKIIDFGIAKALGQSLTDNTLHTGYSQLVGTPLYMSPEQAEMNLFGVDTRSDVYSLGVMLYELLTGTTPFDKETLTKVGFDEMRRIIREQEPPRPSARVSTLQAAILSTVSSRRNIDPRRISLALRGELDWIVMKALEKDRSDRYESASALARDVERFLLDEPVQACPPTAAYRFRKFARKHRAALSTGLIVAASLLIGIVVSSWQAVRATTAEAQAAAQRDEAKEQRDDAKKQRDEVKAVNEKLEATQAELRNTLYAAHMNLARNAWETKNIARMRRFLEQHIPKPGETDLRGFEWHYFQRLLHPELLTIRGHTGVQHVAYSPDGKRLASAAQGGEVKVWDSQTGRELLSLHSGAEDSRFHPDGKRVGDGVDRERKRVEAAAFSSDGKRLASGRKVWDANTGKELVNIQGHGWIRAFSPDGTRLVGTGFRGQSGDWASHVIVWDAETGAELMALKGHVVTLKGHTDHIDVVTYSPDGKRIASACHDQTVKIWDAQSGKELLTYRGHKEGVQSVAFSPDGQRLASGSWGPTVHIWEAATGNIIHELAASSRIDEVAFSPDGKRVACASQDGLIRVWDARTGALQITIEGQHSVRSVTFSPDGQLLASASLDVRVWDANKVWRADDIVGGRTENVFGVTFSPDGKRLASGTAKADNDKIYQGGDVKIWEARTTPGAQTGKSLLALPGHTLAVWSVAYSPDGKRLASASHDKKIKIWDASTGDELKTLTGHTGLVRTVVFNADGRHLASAADDETIKLWDLESGEARTLPGTRTSGMWMATKGLAFSPDGKRLAGGSGETLKIWDVASGRVLSTIENADPRHLLGLAFSPDGRYLARSSASSSVKIWDTQTGQDVRQLSGHNSVVYTLAYSPDGKRLASSSLDATVKIWNPHSGQELLSLSHPNRVHHVAFSPDGHRLATNGPGSAFRIWDATPLTPEP